jgi:hypothetical protein
MVLLPIRPSLALLIFCFRSHPAFGRRLYIDYKNYKLTKFKFKINLNLCDCFASRLSPLTQYNHYCFRLLPLDYRLLSNLPNLAIGLRPSLYVNYNFESITCELKKRWAKMVSKKATFFEFKNLEPKVEYQPLHLWL